MEFVRIHTSMIETHKRTLARAISYRIIATAVTAFFTGLSAAILLHIVLTLIHYASERVWLRIKWGMIRDEEFHDTGYASHSVHMTGKSSNNSVGH